MTSDENNPVLILGAGINGAAVARELLLNNISVVVVDTNDIACGATSRSSRLIHGGLRYLEYADFKLVRESLKERTLLHQLAPQFVKPLQLHIPVASRFGGFVQSTLKFLRLSYLAEKMSSSKRRGMWLVRIGLWFYDRMVTDPSFPNSQVTSLKNKDAMNINSTLYRWSCSYWDAQILYPERFVLSMFQDAQLLAKENDASFQLLPYHNIQLQEKQIELLPLEKSHQEKQTITPAIIINASGAWGDLTLDEMNIPHSQLLGGTKGSHCIIQNDLLRNELGDSGIYAEAADGRPVFLLPFAENTILVGTTDIPFTEHPEQAIATEEELIYLLNHVRNLFPQIEIPRHHIIMHYSGVRPLPFAPPGKTAAISRGHSIHITETKHVPVVTLIGGKLTTCRAFAEDVVLALKEKLSLSDVITSQNRPFPGADNYPQNEEALQQEWQQLSDTFHIDIQSIITMWKLCGTHTKRFLQDCEQPFEALISGTTIPRAFVLWVIQHEWVDTLDDLVERRLMLLFKNNLTRQTIIELAECLVDANIMKADEVESHIENTINTLNELYGKQIHL